MKVEPWTQHVQAPARCGHGLSAVLATSGAYASGAFQIEGFYSDRVDLESGRKSGVVGLCRRQDRGCLSHVQQKPDPHRRRRVISPAAAESVSRLRRVEVRRAPCTRDATGMLMSGAAETGDAFGARIVGGILNRDTCPEPSGHGQLTRRLPPPRLAGLESSRGPKIAARIVRLAHRVCPAAQRLML